MKYPVRRRSGQISVTVPVLSMIVILLLLVNIFPLVISEPTKVTPPTRAEGVLVDEVPLSVNFPDLDPRYVMICPDEFKEELIPLAVHRTKLGLPSKIYTIDSIESNYTGVDREQKVHNFLRSLHQAYPSFKWLFIVGDSEHLRPRALWHYAYDRGQPFHNYYYSDVYYAGLDHDWDTDQDGRYGEYSVQGVVDGDLDWDITVGRLPASTEVHAANYISKLIRYERNPPVGSWMGRFLNWGSLMEPPNLESGENRYWDHKSNAYKVGKKVEANLPPELEVKSLYDYPQLEGGNYTVGDGRDTLYRGNMLTDLNNGASMINFVGQARYEAYALNDYGPPTGNGSNWRWNEPMSYADHSIFTNSDMMPFMYASTCDTAKFFDEGAYNDRSLETWLTSPTGGVIGLISSTGTSARGEETSLSWGNWYLDEEFWKLFFKSGDTRPGKAMFLLKEQYENKWLSPTMEIKETILGMLYAYILLGDPWVDIYTAPAERFMVDTAIMTDFYTGNHTVRFQVLDRDLDPVNKPTVTIYNDDIYMVLTGNENGWVNATIDLGTSSQINLTLSGHNMVPAFYRYEVEPAVSDVVLSSTYSISPEVYSLGDLVDIELEVTNHGGMDSEDVALHVIYNGGNGDPTGHYVSIPLGDISPGEEVLTGFNWTVRPGNHLFSLIVDSSSPEVDPYNNELEIEFDTVGPSFLFNQGSGIIRPSSISPPGSMISIDYNILNVGLIPGSIEIQLFTGDPEINGTALSDIISVNDIPVDSYGNGSIHFETPENDGILYLLMDPLDRYPSDFIDEPERSLLVVNYPPRWIDEAAMAILEDSKNNRLRIDTLVSDDDNHIQTLKFEILSSENLTATISNDGEDGVFLTCDPWKNWFGETSIEISVFDGLSLDILIVNVSVRPVNDDPYFVDAVQGLIELTILEDEPFHFVLRGDDIDSNGLIFEYSGQHLTVDGLSGNVTWSPIQDDVGTMDHTVKVKDTDGGSTTLVLRITVIEVNDPPTIGQLSDTDILVGEQKNFQLEVFDEEGEILTFGSSRLFVWIDEDGMLFINGSSEHQGTNNVKVFVSDGLNTMYMTFNVTVKGETGGSGLSDKGDLLKYSLGGAGIALAIILLLFLGFLYLKRTGADEQVRSELEEADDLYDEDMDAMDDEYEDDDDLEEE